MSFECATRTHVGLRRKINEDSLFVDPARGLWAVADGMGGHQAGEVASNMVVDALRCLPPAPDLDRLASGAGEALRRVNSELIELARSGGRERNGTIGTTVVGLAIADEGFRCFWMGDSRAYQLRGSTITRLTHDHSVVQNLVDAGLLRQEEAETHANANLITRAIGVDEEFDIEFASGTFTTGDQFVLASDGLTRVVRDDELAAELQHGTIEEAADRLIDMVMARGAPDNVSLIIVRPLR